MGINKEEFKEFWRNAYEQEQQEEYALWGTINSMPISAGATGQPSDIINSPRFKEIALLLSQNPIMLQPVLEWIRTALAKIEHAKLVALYGEERVAAMEAAMRQQIEKENVAAKTT